MIVDDESVKSPLEAQEIEHEALDQLVKVLGNSQLSELEEILVELDPEEQTDYLVTLEDGHELRSQVHNLARKFMTDFFAEKFEFEEIQEVGMKFSSNIRRLMRSPFVGRILSEENQVRRTVDKTLGRRDKELAMELLRSSVGQLQQSLGMTVSSSSQEEGLQLTAENIRNLFLELYESLENLLGPYLDKGGFSEKLARDFVNTASQYFTVGVGKLLYKNKGAFSDFVYGTEAARGLHSKESKANLIPAMFAYDLFHKQMQVDRGSGTLAQIKTSAENDSFSADKYMEDVFDMARYRLLASHETTVRLEGGVKIHIHIGGMDLLPAENAREYAYGLVSLSLDPSLKVIPPQVKEGGEISFYNGSKSENDRAYEKVMRFGVSRSTGELTCYGYLTDHKETIGSDNYDGLRWLVAKALHQYLSAKTDDNEYSSQLKPGEVISDEEIDEVESDVADLSKVVPRPDGLDTRNRVTRFELSGRVDRDDFARALKKIPGVNLLRTKGSHHQFKNEASPECVITVAIHPGSSLAPGEIRKNLEILGISESYFIAKGGIKNVRRHTVFEPA